MSADRVPPVTVRSGDRIATITHHPRALAPRRYRVACETDRVEPDAPAWATFPSEAWEIARRWVERADETIRITTSDGTTTITVRDA